MFHVEIFKNESLCTSYEIANIEACRYHFDGYSNSQYIDFSFMYTFLQEHPKELQMTQEIVNLETIIKFSNTMQISTAFVITLKRKILR